MTTPFRADNFSAGPAGLPTAVLEKAKDELLNWQSMGVSVMEISHRSPEFIEVASRAEHNLRTLLGIPDDYSVLFLQGGASLQFAAIPLNLMGEGGSADFIDTGIWSTKAIVEAQKYGSTNIIASTQDTGYTSVPAQSELSFSSGASYVHYCPNETISGVAFDYVPACDKPLVADMSSTILSAPIAVEQFGLIYAGAQKNIGPAGLTLVIVRNDLLERARATCPRVLHYKTQAKADSMSNTPPTFSWYLAGLVFEWLIEQGGLGAMQKVNETKAKLLYDLIDGSEFYVSKVAEQNRSLMNVSFNLRDESLNSLFLSESKAANLLFLKGHRSVGGMRASIYNAVELAAVERLANFMVDFASKHS